MKNILFLTYLILLGISVCFYLLESVIYFWTAIWITYLVASVLIFYSIRKIAFNNLDKINGRPFELFFFLSFLMATYSLTLIFAQWLPNIMTVAFIISIVGAVFCGHMHYVDGLFSENYTKFKKEKKQ